MNARFMKTMHEIMNVWPMKARECCLSGCNSFFCHLLYIQSSCIVFWCNRCCWRVDHIMCKIVVNSI